MLELSVFADMLTSWLKTMEHLLRFLCDVTLKEIIIFATLYPRKPDAWSNYKPHLGCTLQSTLR